MLVGQECVFAALELVAGRLQLCRDRVGGDAHFEWGSEGRRLLFEVDDHQPPPRLDQLPHALEVCRAVADVVVGVAHEDEVDRLGDHRIVGLGQDGLDLTEALFLCAPLEPRDHARLDVDRVDATLGQRDGKPHREIASGRADVSHPLVAAQPQRRDHSFALLPSVSIRRLEDFGPLGSVAEAVVVAVAVAVTVAALVPRGRGRSHRVRGRGLGVLHTAARAERAERGE